MRRVVMTEGNYIISVGMGNAGDEVTEERYNEILAAIRSKPQRTETTDYRLKTDLTWEPYKVDPEPEPEPDAEEILNIIFGGGGE